MKRTLTLIACVAICSAIFVSCKSTKTTEPTPEEIQAQKQALADSVLADIDALAEQFYDASSNSFRVKTMELTDAEKLVKPDYLLDPAIASTFITKNQKVNALGIYVTDRGVRKLYGMPCEEVDEVIAKLAAEVNFPVDLDLAMGYGPVSEKIKKMYELFKEQGSLPLFWQYYNAVYVEYDYFLAKNPELFFSRITEEQFQAYHTMIVSRIKAIEELAQYDEEMAQLWEWRNKNRVHASDEERDNYFKSVELTKQYIAANGDKFIAKRNSLLQ